MDVRRGSQLALLVFGMSAKAVAQQTPDTSYVDSTVFRLPGIVVGASTPVTTVGGASAIHTRLDSMRVPVAPTLEAVFRALPMLHVRRNSRGEAEISVRGSESRQVAVLVDGVPLTLAWDARADVSVIPATAPQSINFVRGLSSMLYGPNVLGGIIELEVAQSFYQPRRVTAEIGMEANHVGGTGMQAGLALPMETGSGRWLVRAGVSRRDSPGLPLARGVVEPIPAANGLRVNTDASDMDGFLSVRYHNWDGAYLAFSGSAFQADRGIAAELGVDDARFWRYPYVSRSLFVASAGTGDRRSPVGGRGDLEASVGVDLGRFEIDSYTDRTYATTDGFENGDDRTLTARVLGDHTIGRNGEFRAAFTLSDIRHDEYLPDGDARYRQRLWSVGGETAWRAFEGGEAINWVRISVGGAYDVGQTPETGGREPLGTIAEWGARVGVSVGLGGGTTLLHGGVSRRGRFPSLRELYSGALDRFAPNPDLTPENLIAIEAGVTTRLGRGELQAVAFRHRLNDAVVRITLPDRRFMRVNRDRLDSYGLELLASSTFGWLALGGDLAVQSVSLTDLTAAVTNQPENLPEVFGGVHAGFPLPFGVRGVAQARYTGTQFCIDPGTGADTQLDPAVIVGGQVSRVVNVRSGGGALFGRVEARIAVDNAGGATLYDQCGLPQPGRLVRFQIRVF